MIEIGKKFGRLIVRAEVTNGYRCECSCGKEPVFTEEDLKVVKSCGCIVILGLDLATNSGWAVRYSWRHGAAIKCGVFNVAENNSGEEVSWETKYALAARQIYDLIVEHRPDFVAIEEAEHRVTQFSKKKNNPITGLSEEVNTINPSALQLTGISGAAIGICMREGVACGTIPSRSWHAKYHKGEKPGPKEDWKDVAIRSCERDNVPLPPTKKAQRDAAEAVCVSGCWIWCKVLDISWMRKRWMDLRTNAYAARAKREGIAA
ncbi:hypothetical protein [Rhizobium rhizogenes]|uniref:hypothetical protein n=1 Tax=Rhizobium rhizogenes TaxID=359 RepID=UPI00226EBD88|nr:hypothetical protein [Rhizobium rhizogenes]